MNADIRHAEAYHRASTLYRALGELSPDDFDGRLHRRSLSERLAQLRGAADCLLNPAGYRIAAVAAMVVAAVAISTVQFSDMPDATVVEPVSLTLTTVRSETLTETLADGTVVTLGASSEIDVILGADRREVRLRAGAALFDVAPDASRPFSVGAGRVTATAIGTAFDVRHSGGVVRVAVAEGRVEVGHPFMIGGEATGIVTRKNLVAGEQIAATSTAGLRPVRRIDPEAVGAWRDARLDYAGATLAELVADANRYSARKIVVDDPLGVLNARTISASFDGKHIDRMLATLPRVVPVVVDTTDPQAVVIRPRD